MTNSSPGQVLSVDSELFREVANQWGSDRSKLHIFLRRGGRWERGRLRGAGFLLRRVGRPVGTSVGSCASRLLGTLVSCRVGAFANSGEGRTNLYLGARFDDQLGHDTGLEGFDLDG